MLWRWENSCSRESDDNEQDAQEWSLWIIVTWRALNEWQVSRISISPRGDQDESARPNHVKQHEKPRLLLLLLLSGSAPLAHSHVSQVSGANPLIRGRGKNHITWVSNNAPIQPFIMILRCLAWSGVIITCALIIQIRDGVEKIDSFRSISACTRTEVFCLFRPTCHSLTTTISSSMLLHALCLQHRRNFFRVFPWRVFF